VNKTIGGFLIHYKTLKKIATYNEQAIHQFCNHGCTG
jgi:hypothetical protein